MTQNLIRSLATVVTILLFSVPIMGQEPAEKTHFGKPLAFWLDGVKSTNALERDEALLVLTQVGPPAKAAAPSIKPLLKSSEPSVQFLAALALWSVDGQAGEAAPVLATSFDKWSHPQKQQIFQALLKVHQADESLFPLLVAFQKEQSYQYQLPNFFAGLGADAGPFFKKFVEHKTGPDRSSLLALTPLQLLIETKGEIIAGYLKDPEPLNQLSAAYLLLRVPQRHADAVDVLLGLTKSMNADLAGRALGSLVYYRPVIKKAEGVYLEAIKTKSLAGRITLSQALLAIRKENVTAVLPTIEEGIGSADFNVRYQALAMVPQLGAAGEKLVPALLSQLKQLKNPGDAYPLLIALVPHRTAAGKDIAELIFAEQKGTAGASLLVPVLQKFGDDLVEPVKQHLSGEDAKRRKLALQVASYLPLESGDKLVPLIAPFLKSDDSGVVAAALVALERYGKASRPVVPELVALLEGPHGQKLRKQIEHAVLRIQPDPKDAAAILKKHREKASLTPQERFFAVEVALTVPGKEKEAAELLESLLSEKNLGGVGDIRKLLSKLGPEAAGLVPTLHKQIKASPSLVENYEEPLRRIGPAAKVVLPEVYARLKTTQSTDSALRLCKLVYTLDPEQRKVAEEKLVEVFGAHLDKYWWGDEVNYLIFGLENLCRIKPGPSPALEPLLLQIFRKPKSDDIQGRIGVILVKLDKKHEDEVVRTLAEKIKPFVNVSRGVLAALVQIKPDHPKALAVLKDYLRSPQSYDKHLGLSVVNDCPQPLPGVREIITGVLSDELDPSTRFLAYTAIMRLDNKLNEKWIDEMLDHAIYPGPLFVALDALRHLGPLGKPLIPRLSALGTRPELTYQLERVIEALVSE